MSGSIGKTTINKLLLIIAGECFREGGQTSRIRDTEISIENQLKATDSHINFINYLYNKYNITIDVQLLSYSSKYENILIEKYQKFNLNYKFYNSYFIDRTQLVNSTKIQDISEKYDGILIIRPDMYLKPFFFQLFDPYLNKICYPSVCYIGQHSVHQYPRVNDTIIFIPKKYFDIVYYKIGIKLYHEAILDYVTHSKAIGQPLSLHIDFDFMLKTLHDSDSYKDYNPIYTLVSRPENKKWHSYGYQIRIDDFLPIEINQKYIFPDWNIKSNIAYDLDLTGISSSNLWEWWHKDINSFSYFVNLIEIDHKQQNKFNITRPSRHFNETYWKINNQELFFYDHNYNLTSILYQQSPIQFFGKSLHNNFYFTLKKSVNIDLNT